MAKDKGPDMTVPRTQRNPPTVNVIHPHYERTDANIFRAPNQALDSQQVR